MNASDRAERSNKQHQRASQLSNRTKPQRCAALRVHHLANKRELGTEFYPDNNQIARLYERIIGESVKTQGGFEIEYNPDTLVAARYNFGWQTRIRFANKILLSFGRGSMDYSRLFVKIFSSTCFVYAATKQNGNDFLRGNR